MRHLMRGMTLTAAILWGACMLIVGLINLADPSYGGEFLRMMNSIYPGADATRSIGSVLLGTVYGFVDGAVFGWLFSMLLEAIGTDHHHAQMSSADSRGL